MTSEQACDPAEWAHYEVRVQYALTPALMSYLGATRDSTTAGRGEVVRLQGRTDLDLAQIVELFAANDIDILNVRLL